MREYLQEGDLISVIQLIIIFQSLSIFTFIGLIALLLTSRQKCSPSSQMAPSHFTLGV